MPSKRRNSTAAGDQATKRKKLDSTLFGEVLAESGFVVNFTNEPYMLETDQALFQRKLQKLLRAHPVHCHPASTKEFLRGLETHLADGVHLKWALLYTETGSAVTAARAGHQDSLLRLLLNIDELQTPILTMLTERLLEIAYAAGSDEDHSLPRLILANLQRLDRLADPPTVADKILQLLQCAPSDVQKEVVSFLPEIVDDSSHPRVAEELCKLYYSSPELSVPILDSLPALSLSPEALAEVKHSVQKTVQAARPEHLAIVVKFLLEDAGKAEELVADLRDRVRLVPSSSTNPAPSSQPAATSAAPAAASDDASSHEMALLHNIKFSFLVERRQHLSWLKALDRIPTPSDHHPLDLLLVLQLHDTAPARQRLVEGVLKKKVRAGVFTKAVLQKTFVQHAQTLKHFVATIRHVAAFLLRCPGPVLSAYGTEIYRQAFVSFSGQQQQAVLMGLLSHASDPSHVRQHALQLLQTLADENTDALARYAGFVKGWLDLLDQLTLAEARQLMGVLSTLAFRAADQAATIGDEIQMLIHKQLANSAPRYKRLGIVSVLMAIKCRQDTSETSSSTGVSEDSQSSEIVLTTVAQRETVQLLRTAQAAVVQVPAARGLLLDELASQVWRAGLDPKIEHWICDQMMDEFQESFVVDSPDGEPECSQMKLCLKYGLEEAGAGEIALNVTPMLLKNSESLTTLCAQFRLLRMCIASLEGGSMDKLDALLGCPVILPADDVIDSLSQLSVTLRRTVVTSLFHCLNFFRELLNAFSTQKDQELKRRCVLRLRAVMQLEGQLRRCLPLVPGFVPPPALFDCDAQPPPPATKPAKKAKPAAKRKGKGKSKSADVTVNQSAISQLETSPTQSDRACASSDSTEADLAGYRPFLRELDMDLYKLLYRRFSLTENTTEEFCVRPGELHLLLDDLTLKLERRLCAAPCSGLAILHAASGARGLGYSHLDLLPEQSVAKQAVTLLKPLSVIAETVVGLFKSQITDNDGMLDGPGMFGEEADRLAVCLSAIYRIFGLLLSWPGLTEPDHQQLAKEALSNLRISESGRSQPVSNPAPSDAGRAFALLRQHAAFAPRVECAANLARAMSALVELSGEPSLRETLADCAESFLKREWFSAAGVRQCGATFSRRVDVLLKLLLAAPQSRLTRLEALCRQALPELQEATGRDAASDSFPTLTKSTFGQYYRVMFTSLVEAVRDISGPEQRQLNAWASALHVFNALVSCLKSCHARSAIGVCLKHSRRLVELFVRHAIPMLELMLKHQKQEVLTLLKNFQISARYLHHVCNHSKLMKDASLMNHVPLLKKGLESFVFRVKAMLALNGCTEAFWMGNLKNRDLQGDEILSQSQQTTDSDGEQEGEEEEQSDVDLEAEEERDGGAANGDAEKHESEISDAY